MNFADIIVMSCICPFGACLGLVIWRFIQVHWQLTSKQILLIVLLCIFSIPVYGIIGFSGYIGFVYPVEMFIVSTLYGTLLGPVQSATRTCFCDIIPPGQESEFFGIFEITDKGSSWMGPLVCGVFFELTGSMRFSFFYILGVGLIGIWLTLSTDFVEGSEACR